jgi:hypothetical protein
MKKLSNRYIAFFDIIGFSKKVEESNNLADLYCEYKKIIDDINKEITSKGQDCRDNKIGELIKWKKVQKVKIFSDSIIVISHDYNNEEFLANLRIKDKNDFLLYVNFLMFSFFENGFPLRGLIFKDDIIMDEENDIYLSKLFPKIVKEERDYDWSGCVIDKSAQDDFVDLVANLEKQNPFVNYTLPIFKPCSTHFQLSAFNELRKKGLIQPEEKIKIFKSVEIKEIEMKDLKSYEQNGWKCYRNNYGDIVEYDAPKKTVPNKEKMLCLNWLTWLKNNDQLKKGINFLNDEGGCMKRTNTLNFMNKFGS